MMLYSCLKFTHVLRMLNVHKMIICLVLVHVRCISSSLLLLAPIAVRGHGMHFALVRAQIKSMAATLYVIIIHDTGTCMCMAVA